MANNRIYIQCRECGDYCFLGKTSSGIYYHKQYYNMPPLEEKLNKFYEYHSFCINKDEPDYHYENQFRLAYETHYDDEIGLSLYEYEKQKRLQKLRRD
jgi:hypothetical protein